MRAAGCCGTQAPDPPHNGRRAARQGSAAPRPNAAGRRRPRRRGCRRQWSASAPPNALARVHRHPGIAGTPHGGGPARGPTGPGRAAAERRRSAAPAPTRAAAPQYRTCGKERGNWPLTRELLALANRPRAHRFASAPGKRNSDQSEGEKATSRDPAARGAPTQPVMSPLLKSEQSHSPGGWL